MNSRREFLQQVAVLGGISGLLAACHPKPAQLDCSDVQALTDAEKQMRVTLQYTDKSPDPAKVCGGCNFFQKPGMPDICGGCTLIKGPVSPAGHCTSWVQKAS